MLSRINKYDSIKTYGEIKYDDACQLSVEHCSLRDLDNDDDSNIGVQEGKDVDNHGIEGSKGDDDTCPSSIAASDIWSTMVNPRGASQEAAYSTPVFTLLAPLPGKKTCFMLFRQNYF